MILLEEALKKLTPKAGPLEVEEVPVLKSLGRVLREDIKSPLTIPPFNKSAMDGYAVKSADVAGASSTSPVELEVLEDIPAGHVGKQRLKKGAAARIMTGAPIPAGADAVVMVEYTERTNGGVLIMKEAKKGGNIAPAGEDVKKGQRVVRAGVVIGAAEMGMIASTGRSRIKVGRKPKVAVLSTGSEVVAPGQQLNPGRIYDSNGYSLTGLAVARGADAKFLGIAPDRKGALEQKINRARDCDVLILSGGVSVGDYDLAQDILLGLGVKKLFWKVLIKPGMPIFAGTRGKRFVFGLPGNPVSCMVTFELFVRPVLDVMLGKREMGPRRGRAILADDARIKPDRRKFLRGKLKEIDGRLEVSLFPVQRSGVLRSMVEADVLVDVPHGVTKLNAGAEVDVLYLE